MTTHLRNYGPRVPTLQSESARADQVENSAGGFGFAVDDWQRLQRFLILGTEGGTYYVGQHQITKDNADSVARCIAADGKRVVDTIVEVSNAGRAAKNDYALFAYAMCLSASDVDTRRYAGRPENFNRVVRIGTHLLHLAAYMEQFRGWGRLARTVVGQWFTSKSPSDLALQAVKYYSRDDWSLRDLLRLAHPQAILDDGGIAQLLAWIAGQREPLEQQSLPIIEGFHAIHTAVNDTHAARIITDYQLPREAVPTERLNSREVWQALLPHMPMNALVRSLGKLTAVGVLAPYNRENVASVAERLQNRVALRGARVHPIAMLSALRVYGQGHGERGKLTWHPTAAIVDALDAGFYDSFGVVQPTNKNIVIGLDVSGSMVGTPLAGVPGLDARMGAAAMALVTAKTEPSARVSVMAFSTTPVLVSFSPRQRLDDVIKETEDIPFGSTDCAMPMLWAEATGLHDIDAFIIYTDSETWAGNIHPFQVLNDYRRRHVPNAKLVVVGMASNGFTIADPNDGGMLDVVGFDTATPEIISAFVRGEV